MTTASSNSSLASATAHTYQPFYLPREDTPPVSDSLDAAKREYFITVTRALSIANTYRPFYLLPEHTDLEVTKREFMKATRALNVDVGGNGTMSSCLDSRRVMGPTGSGKTSFIRIISGSNLPVGSSLQSCTNTVQVATPFKLNGRWVTLIDTPGFDDTSRSDTEMLTQIVSFLATTYENKKLADVICIHCIPDTRMGGISTRNFKMFRQLCGESTLRNVVIVANMWAEVEQEVGEAQEAELASNDKFFEPVFDKGARLLRHTNDVASAQEFLHYLVGNQPCALRIQRELVGQGQFISQTAAGEELNREFAEKFKRYKQEMAILQQEMKEAIRAKDEETSKLQAEMTRAQSDSRKLASDYAEQKVELENRMAEVAEAARREAECAEENHRRQVQELQDRLHQSTTAANSEKEEIHRKLSDLQQQYEQMRSKKSRRRIFGNIGRALDGAFHL
ncbi:P-loop containing nucleoside triphosphate hydrolase protein [Mycena capillaripes]|nr:P-loop containing nucleoside triphosphate hydrolase protein [Mycena capillaripes]